jgi:hypothetical protein
MGNYPFLAFDFLPVLLFISGGRLLALEEAGLTVPAAPSSLTATATSSTQINLSWTDNSNNETGFKIAGEREWGKWCLSAM